SPPQPIEIPLSSGTPLLTPCYNGVHVKSKIPLASEIKNFHDYLHQFGLVDISREHLINFFQSNIGRDTEDFLGFRPDIATNTDSKGPREWIAKIAGKHISIFLGFEPQNNSHKYFAGGGAGRDGSNNGSF